MTVPAPSREGFIAGRESPRMASPPIAAVAVIVGIALIVLGVFQLPVCSGNALLLFGIGVFFVGIGAALLGGVLVLYPSVFFAAVLIVLSFVVSRGVSGCWI